MPAVELTTADLAPFATIPEAKAQAMIDTALARAARVAPCIREDSLTDDNAEAAKGVIRDAVLRWNDSGGGMVQYQTAGPFSQSLDTRQPRKALFWPSEIEELQAICADHNGVTKSGAFSIQPAGTTGSHAPFCDLMFGGGACSCGANLTNFEYPLYEA